MSNKLKAVLVLPTKNEAESIEGMIKQIRGVNIPFFVIDEKSVDGTIEKAKKLNVKVYQRKGSGKGYGMIEGIKIASDLGYDVIAFIDCDSTYPVEKIPEMLELMSDYDMVVGTRPFNSINFFHRIGNLAHTLLINILFFANLHDINSGLRTMKIKKFVNLLDAKGFDIEAQITVRALKKRYKIKEIPIKYKERKGQSKILHRDGLIIFWKILKERFSA